MLLFNFNASDAESDKIGSLLGNLKEKNVNCDFFHYKSLFFPVLDVKENF